MSVRASLAEVPRVNSKSRGIGAPGHHDDATTVALTFCYVLPRHAMPRHATPRHVVLSRDASMVVEDSKARGNAMRRRSGHSRVEEPHDLRHASLARKSGSKVNSSCRVLRGRSLFWGWDGWRGPLSGRTWFLRDPLTIR